MKILISILRFDPGKTLGSEVYLRSLLGALSNIVKNEKITIAASERGVEWGKKIAPGFSWISQPISNSILKRMMSESSEIEKIAETNQADVIFFPFNIMPKVNFPSVLLIHDLVSEFYTRKFPFYRPIYFRAVKSFLRKSVRRADNLLTISSFIADELKKSKFIKTDQDVFVAPLASQPVLIKTKKPSKLILDDRKIILQTGDHLPHKSHITGLRAIALLSTAYPDLIDKIHLVLTGGNIKNNSLEKYVFNNKIEKHVTFLGKVSNEELEWLMQESSLIAFPTIYEGFGLGVIEAQLRDRPIILSDIPVLREVSGNQAIFFEPENSDELAEKIKTYFHNDLNCNYLIEAGKENALRWNWENHARIVLDVLRKTAKLDKSVK